MRKCEKEFGAHYLAVQLEEGEDTRLKTIAKMVFTINGKEYPYEEDFGYAYPASDAHYMFEDGNYSCDCNRSLFISQKYIGFPKMPCGNKIEMKDFQVLHIQGTDKQFEETI